jgi:nucleoside permease NupC
MCEYFSKLLGAPKNTWRDKQKFAQQGRRFRFGRLALSKTAIAQLQVLALNTQVAMSAIIHILANELAKKDQK